jgi:hypothetical protein
MDKELKKKSMSKGISKEGLHILPEMTVLDVVSRYKVSEAVFRKYDEQAGVCICCQALFETIAEVASKYRLNLDQFLSDLEEALFPEIPLHS